MAGRYIVRIWHIEGLVVDEGMILSLPAHLPLAWRDRIRPQPSPPGSKVQDVDVGDGSHEEAEEGASVIRRALRDVPGEAWRDHEVEVVEV
jgi:hypothetical protein